MTVEIGGGSTSNICSISPSDMAGSIDNIMERLETLENIVSQMLGYDITANQISDITDVLGWINNVTYMGTTGWTLTPAGTLIPPPGWTFLGSGLTLSDGNTYSAVLVDSDGVLQYGFTTEGQVTGNSSVAYAYGMFSAGSAHGGTTLAEPDQVYFKGVTRGAAAFSTATSSSPITRQETWTVQSSGLYLITLTGHSQITGVSGDAEATLRVSAFCENPTPILSHNIEWIADTRFAGNSNVRGSTTVPARLNAGDQVLLTFMHQAYIVSGTVATYHAIGEYASIIKVGSLT